MTSSNEAEKWNEFFNQSHSLVDSIKNRRIGDEDQASDSHQHLDDSITALYYLVNTYRFLDQGKHCSLIVSGNLKTTSQSNS